MKKESLKPLIDYSIKKESYKTTILLFTEERKLYNN